MRSYRHKKLAVSAVLWTVLNHRSADGFVPSIATTRKWNVPTTTAAEQRRRGACFSSALRRTRLYVAMHNNSSSSSRTNKRESEDFYAILEVSPHSSADEIKRAYRKMAKKYHPDSNIGRDTTDKFQNVNRAYEVLSNPILKSKYDMFGFNGIGTSAASDEIKANRVYSGSSSTSTSRRSSPKPGGMPADGYGMGGIHSNPADIYGGYANGAVSGFGRNVNPADIFDRTGRARYGPGGGMVGDDLQLTMDIDFETAVFGGRQSIWIDHLESCDYCTGSGVKAGSQVNYCDTCGGVGFTVQIAKTAFGSLQTQEACPACKGSGKNVEEYCNYCFGHGLEERSKQIDITIPAGVEGYTRLRIRGEGNAGPKGGPPGDLFIFLKVMPHPVFHRDGASIRSNHTVDYIDAILGSKQNTEVVGGGEVLLEIPEGTQHEEVIRLKGHGARSLIGEPGARGDHIVTVHVEIPDEISEEEEKILLRLKELHGRRKTKRIPDTQEVDTEDDDDFSSKIGTSISRRRGTEQRTSGRSTADDAGTIRIEDFEVTYVSNDKPSTSNAAAEADMAIPEPEMERIHELLEGRANATKVADNAKSSATTQNTEQAAASVSTGEDTESAPFFADQVTNSTNEFEHLKEILQAPIAATATASSTSRTPIKKKSSRTPETRNTSNELHKLQDLLRVSAESSPPPGSKSKKKAATHAELLNTANELDKLRELLSTPITNKKKEEAAAAAKVREIEARKELEKLRQLLREPVEASEKPVTKKSKTKAEINAADELRMLRELILPKVPESNNKASASTTAATATPKKVPEIKIVSSPTNAEKKIEESSSKSGVSDAPARVETKAIFDASTPFAKDEKSKDQSQPTDVEARETISSSQDELSEAPAAVVEEMPAYVDESAPSETTLSPLEVVKSVSSLSSMGKFEESGSLDSVDAPEAALFAEVVEGALSDNMKVGTPNEKEIKGKVDDAYSLSETIGPGGSAENEVDERSFAWEEITADSWRKNPKKSSNDNDGHKFEETLFSIFKP